MKPAEKRRVSAVRRGPSTLFALLVIMIAGTIVYWNSFAVPMVFDDLPTIQKNAGVQFGDSLNLSIGATRPVLYLTFALNYLWNAERVWGYHLVNLILHLLTGVVVFFVAVDLFSRVVPDEAKARTYALLAAAFFVLHPIQTESVTYISSRSETLSTLFFVLGVLLFLKRRPDGVRFLWSLVILIPFLLGLGAKETVITLPVTLLLIDYLFIAKGDPRTIFKRWSFYATFILGGVLAAYYLITRVLVGSIGPGLEGHLSRHDYFLTQLRVIVKYVRLIFLPVNLNLDYDVRPATSLFDPAVIASGLFLVSLLVLAWYLRKTEPILAFSILWFFITLAPTSSFIPILDTIFEHRLYLPLAGVCLAFPVLMERVFRKKGMQVCVAVLVVFMAATVMRNEVWGSDLTLWEDVVKKSPGKIRGYSSLAFSYFKRGQYQKALDILTVGKASVSGKMEQRSFVESMGNMYLQLGRLQEAADAFEETTKVDDAPAAALAYNNLGVAYMRLFRDLEQKKASIGEAAFAAQGAELLRKSATALSKSVALNPSYFWPFDLYIDVMYTSGNGNQISQQMQEVLKEKKDARAYYAIGKIAMLSNDYNKAVANFKDALAVDSSQKVIFFNYGYCLRMLGRLDDAREMYLQALRLDPMFGDAHHNLGQIYSLQEQYPQALHEFQSSLLLNPNRVQTHIEMAKIFIRMGDRRQARTHLDLALSVSPGDPVVMQLLRMIGS